MEFEIKVKYLYVFEYKKKNKREQRGNRNEMNNVMHTKTFNSTNIFSYILQFNKEKVLCVANANE